MANETLRTHLALGTGPDAEPVTLAEVRDYCQIETAAADDLLDSLITAARRRFEIVTGRQLVTATWQLFLHSFPGADFPGIFLPLPPLIEVDYIKYYDPDGTINTVDEAAYIVVAAREPGLVWPAFGCAWPATQSRINAVEIQFQAGYGDGLGTDDLVPADIRQALCLWIKLRYDRRGEPAPDDFNPDDLFRPWCWGDYR